MPSLSAVPSPAELGLWLKVGSLRQATGLYLSSGGEQSGGWFSYASLGAPALCVPRDSSPVRFWHAAPDRWRLEQDDELLAVSDGASAIASGPDGLTRGAVLVVLPGPADLLQPEPAEERRGRRRYADYSSAPAEDAVDGRVEADERLGRRCWRWQRAEETWWVDHETGIALAKQTRHGLQELLELRVADDLALSMFTIPGDLLDRATPASGFEDRAGVDADDAGSGGWTIGWVDEDDNSEQAEPQEQPPRMDFTVAWWPHGSLTYPDSGDPSVPEVLLVLNTGGDERFWLGVTRSGRVAPVKPGTNARRWDGDGWSFALSWLDDLTEHELDRIIESVPPRWVL